MNYTSIMDATAAIIPAAGLSSRMGRFKPLLELNGFPMIQLAAQSALDGGVQNAWIVTGRNAGRVKDALLSLSHEESALSLVQGLATFSDPRQGGIRLVHNSEYAQTDMFQSVRLGLKALLAAGSQERGHAGGSVNAGSGRGDSGRDSTTGGNGAASAVGDARNSEENNEEVFSENSGEVIGESSAGSSAANSREKDDGGSPWTQTEAVSPRAPDAVFVLPGDMPGINPRTFAALRRQGEATGASVLVPVYLGQRGHPLLIGKECFDSVLHFDGEGGLPQALANFEWQELEVDDPSILLDADDTTAFTEVERYVRTVHGVGRAIVERLFATYQTPPNVQAHTEAVAEVALRMAQALNRRGLGLDSELCRSGAYLHDLNRLEPDHSRVAAAHLQALGYDALAAVVAAHDRKLTLTPHMFTEANIVFVADKLIKESTLVKIERRYEGALKRFPPDTELGRLIMSDSQSASALLKRYVEITGDTMLMEGTERFVRESYEKT